ncbi:filamentous hemagglutinin N-terminal domain-containing protein [Leptolyngbya sp. AN03gr2]|uniref:two-partner secretion domain-containing protein n=1 Tax=unclassified Leptolyngbya TaxID=2650499 RepID=UPI003D3193B4
MRRALSCVGLSTVLVCGSASAQVTSDRSTATNVTPLPGNNFIITGGRAEGSNLFHSFGSFSIPTGGSATFNLLGTRNASTIFSRVTGGTVSNIDGRIFATLDGRTPAPVNLFLINPSGVVFGANAQLIVGGSFVGTTASSVRFADGTEFAATNTAPLLTMSAPVGLQFGQNSAAIQVQGAGHQLASASTLGGNLPQNPVLFPYLPTSFSLAGLRVAPGRTLALVGGDVSLNGGIVAASGGRVEIGSVGSGQVGIRPTAQGFELDYGGVASLRNIQMSQRSLVDAGWLLDQSRSAGSIQIQGNNIRLSDGSVVLSQNRGLLPGGDVTVRAAGLLELIGMNSTETISSGIVSETSGLGSNSPVNVSARGLVLQNGGIIQSRSFSPAPGAAVNVAATDFIEMSGFSPQTRVFNTIGTSTFFTSLLINPAAPPVRTGTAGSINVSTQRLSLRDGSTIAALSFGDGSAGNIVVNADTTELTGILHDTIELIEVMPTSLLGVSYRRGNSGTIDLNTRTLNIQDGGTISTTNLGLGNSGSIRVNASESIQMSSRSGTYSNISSTIGGLGDFSSSNLISGRPTGTAGSVTVNTPLLQINQAGIGVGNYGIGSAGTVTVNANTIRLTNSGGISAQTFAGEGGNIDLNARLLILRDRSFITTDSKGASAGSSGDGGNIRISNPLIIASGNSDIVANAIAGRGGTIRITTQGIFGLAFRDLQNPQAVPTNDITASSGISANGTVEITTPGVDPNSGLVELSEDLIDSSQQIAKGCSSTPGSSFVVTGRGGIPINPQQEVFHAPTVWNDLREIGRSTTAIQPSNPSAPLVEASTWQRNPKNGKVELIAAKPAQLLSIETCATSNSSDQHRSLSSR